MFDCETVVFRVSHALTFEYMYSMFFQCKVLSRDWATFSYLDTVGNFVQIMCEFRLSKETVVLELAPQKLDSQQI